MWVVGPGARWQVAVALDSMGMKVNQTSTVTLERTEGRRVALAVEGQQTAVPQTITPPGPPVGTPAPLGCRTPP